MISFQQQDHLKARLPYAAYFHASGRLRGTGRRTSAGLKLVPSSHRHKSLQLNLKSVVRTRNAGRSVVLVFSGLRPIPICFDFIAGLQFLLFL